MEKYDPHPNWVNGGGYQEAEDMYIEKNAQGKVLTLITCKNKEII